MNELGQNFLIKPCQEEEIPLLLAFIQKLAEYENLSEELYVTEDKLHKHLFGKTPSAYAIIGYYNKQPVSFAIYYYNFSTFKGSPGLYIEDLFVDPGFRGLGIGRELLKHLAKIANEKNCSRMEWSVLDWNDPAINYFTHLGASSMNEWTTYRFNQQDMQNLINS